MKFHRYFLNTVMVKRSYIHLEWIEHVLNEPILIEVQSDGRIRHWAYIDDLGKYLRVVTLDDGETVFNAFPDHRFRP